MDALDRYVKEREKRDSEFAAARAENFEEHEIILAFIRERKAQGLTQAALSARSGVSQADISRFETGVLKPTLTTLLRLSNALGKQLMLVAR